MSQLELTYFSDNKGRNELSRLICAFGGVEFKDEAIDPTEYRLRREAGQLPYGQLPTLKVDGEAFGQSCAIARYVARRAGLYPTDELEQLRSDGVVDSWRDVLDLFYETVFGRRVIGGRLLMFPHPQNLRHRKLADLAATALPEHFAQYEAMLRPTGRLCESAPFPAFAELAVFDLVKTMGAVLEPPVFAALMAPVPAVAAMIDRVDALEPARRHLHRHPYVNISRFFRPVPWYRAGLEAALFPAMRAVMAVAIGTRNLAYTLTHAVTHAVALPVRRISSSSSCTSSCSELEAKERI